VLKLEPARNQVSGRNRLRLPAFFQRQQLVLINPAIVNDLVGQHRVARQDLRGIWDRHVLHILRGARGWQRRPSRVHSLDQGFRDRVAVVADVVFQVVAVFPNPVRPDGPAAFQMNHFRLEAKRGQQERGNKEVDDRCPH